MVRAWLARRCGIGSALCVAFVLVACIPATIVSHAIIMPGRVWTAGRPSLPADDVTFDGAGVTLRGWLFRTPAARKGTVVFLHGAAHNRAAGLPVYQHLVPLGWDVLAYDNRGQGDSGGDAMTYGYFEKKDVVRALDFLGADHVILVGVSGGGAVALQAAADDPRIAGVVAVGTFTDLWSIARERMPWWAGDRGLAEGLALAERRGRFRVSAVSPLQAARRVHVPVLILHGEKDEWVSPEHARRLYEALAGPKQLFIIPGSKHVPEPTPELWSVVDRWLEDFSAGRLTAEAPRS
ncbi:MAG TPA: alpha/beta fold hydrolase [Anaeromyxobacteraceae bacterium]